MTDHRERWALVLGASSGMGEATSRALARAGYNIVGVHLDYRAALAHVREVKAAIVAAGSEALFFNVNAADDVKRAGILDAIAARFAESVAAGREPHLRVFVHSLAFGSLQPFLGADPKARISRKQLDMTLDVMANSLVYWTQDLFARGWLSETRIYALTSEGSSRVIPAYGAVSAAKSALESHCRQLAMELARAGTGCAVNAIRAGVTMTPALMRIPEAAEVIDSTMKRNPSGRMTIPRDVGDAIVCLSGDGLLWMTGNVVSVDGGEFVSGW
ncbi:MAG: SDR family oxidoreductase [Chloroflexota bacterium]